MSDIWAPVVAALGSALLTGLIAFGLERRRSRVADRTALAERRLHAYTALLARSASIMHLASDLHLLMELKSGLREGVSTTIGGRKPLDPLDLASWISSEVRPLYDSWTDVWMVGSKEAIAEANDLVARCGAVMGAATQRGQALPTWLKGIVGEKWTQEQLEQWQAEMRSLAESRRKFGVIARKETGVESADLFGSNEVNPSSNAKLRTANSERR